ncbi:hypothetical protein OE88DRAFT_1045034 [Heliocybe sulcata]|uniref:Uncharacterized protein n=1 Tax=Heliocybe sulcata TaxID=5364 RepID=A0A5C3MMW9_9AGAM|nr:hypothetical protein OE88DRAFT_1045034 [Heliocybe sulcata]
MFPTSVPSGSATALRGGGRASGTELSVFARQILWQTVMILPDQLRRLGQHRRVAAAVYFACSCHPHLENLPVAFLLSLVFGVTLRFAVYSMPVEERSGRWAAYTSNHDVSPARQFHSLLQRPHQCWSV